MSHHMYDSGKSIDLSICHMINMTSPSICQSHDFSVCHTIIMTSPSICQSHDSSVCHTIIMTSPSICQLHDSSVCQPNPDATWKSICPSVSPSSVLSIQPSAKFMVKMLTCIPVQNFPKYENPRKLLSIHPSSDLSVDPSGSPSITSPPSAENQSRFPGINGENVVNYLYKIPVISTSVCTSCVMSVIAPIQSLSIPSICTLCIMSVIAPVHVLPILSVHPSDDECQETPVISLVLNMGRKPIQNYS